MRHFSELTNQEKVDLSNHLIEAAILYTDSIGIGGLSQLGSHDLYVAIQDAVEREHCRAGVAKSYKMHPLLEPCDYPKVVGS